LGHSGAPFFFISLRQNRKAQYRSFTQLPFATVNPQRFFSGKEKAKINELSKWISA
jgi:hypothetical protein